MTIDYYQESFQVPFYECDPQGDMHLSAAMNHLILASERQLSKLGVGPKELSDRRLGWVTTEYEIEITALPRQHDHVQAKTAALQYNKFFCYRDYWLLAQTGETLVHVRSIWIMMSYQNRKMAKLPDDLTAKMGSRYDSAVQRLPRLQPFENQTQDLQKQYQVRYFDIDANQHVNNAHYFDWMLDCLPATWLKTHQIKQMQLRYEHEVRYGEQIHSRAKLDQKQQVSQHQITKDSAIAAQAQVQWQHRCH